MKQGIVMEIQARRATVFTNDCSLIKVESRKDMFVGQSIQIPEPAVSKTGRRRCLLPCLAAACLVLFLAAGALLAFLVLPQAQTVYLSLDINPSVEFVLDANRKVTSTIPMNSDAWEVLGDNDFKGLSYEKAIAGWVDLVRRKMPEQLDYLLISAVLSRRDRDFAVEIMALSDGKAGDKIPGLSDLQVTVLYTMDSSVKSEADANNLSFGRQMLFDKALEKKLGMDADDIRTAPLQTLCASLLPEKTGLTSETAEPSASETSGTTAKPKPETCETIAETSATAKITETSAKETETSATAIKETTKAPTKATTSDPYGERLLKVTENGENGWKLSWTIAPDDKGLKYYKVVISKNTSKPMYPDNGYLHALSRENNDCRVNNGSEYHGGDINCYLVPGEQYTVAVTYVYPDQKLSSNVLKLTYNGPAAPAPTTTAAPTTAEPLYLHLAEVSNDANGIQLSWDISPESLPLVYYKVVISQGDSAPMYPDDGYLFVVSNRSQTSCPSLIDNSESYSGGDFGGTLVPGQSYYFAVTYVFDGGLKASSNVLHLVYNGPAAP